MESSQSTDCLAILIHAFQEEMCKTLEENAVALKKNQNLSKR